MAGARDRKQPPRPTAAEKQTRQVLKDGEGNATPRGERDGVSVRVIEIKKKKEGVCLRGWG